MFDNYAINNILGFCSSFLVPFLCKNMAKQNKIHDFSVHPMRCYVTWYVLTISTRKFFKTTISFTQVIDQ